MSAFWWEEVSLSPSDGQGCVRWCVLGYLLMIDSVCVLILLVVWVRHLEMGAASNWGGARSWIREGNGTPLQYSCLENPMDGGAWKAAVYGVAEGRTRQSDCNFTFHFHFSLSCIGEGNGNPFVSAWRIPGRGEPGGLWSIGSHRVGHD